MADTSSEFVALLDRARQGDQESLLELARKYEPDVRIVARVLLGPALRPHLDSLDLVQSVHRSLMVGLRQAKFEMGSAQQLVALALTMVRRKVARKWRQHRRQKRLDQPGGAESVVDVLTSLAGSSSDPAQATQTGEAAQRLWNQLSALDRRLIELRLEGCSTAAAARLLNQEPDFLRVRLHRLRQQVRQSGLFDDWL